MMPGVHQMLVTDCDHATTCQTALLKADLDALAKASSYTLCPHLSQGLCLHGVLFRGLNQVFGFKVWVAWFECFCKA